MSTKTPADFHFDPVSPFAFLTAEYQLNLTRPAAGERLRAGRALTVCDLKVHAMREREEVLYASGQQTLMCMETARP